MALPAEILTVLVLAALALGVLALILQVSHTPRGGRQLSESKRAVALLGRHDQDIAKLQRAGRSLLAEQRRQADILPSTLRHVGLVRYDAFQDMGGHLSFSAALLDAEASGLVITSINGRDDTRCYAKLVQAGVGHNLSVEEQEAIRRAMEGIPDRPAVGAEVGGADLPRVPRAGA